MTDVDQMSFEDAIKELETVVGQLERGDVALDQSIALYERGAALKARCEAKLKEAEEKVARITLGETPSVDEMNTRYRKFIKE